MAVGIFGALELGSRDANSRHSYSRVYLAHYTRSDSRYFTSGRRKSDAMAGFHSHHMYTMEEVIGMIDDVDEPMCEGSDDDFDVDDLIIE